MKITHYCNSFITIEAGHTLLACDPWVGTANYGGWLSYPIASGGKEILRSAKPTHLYISHLHSDHLDEGLLSEVAGSTVQVIIKAFRDQRLRRRLATIGFTNIRELKPWQRVKIGTLEIAIVPSDTSNVSNREDKINYDLDTSILVQSQSDGTVFFNKVDNPMTLDQHQRIREFVRQSWNKEVDVACMAVGAASEYPQCFLGIDRTSEQVRVVDSSLKRFQQQLSALGNELYFPAGGAYVIPGKFAALNQYVAAPSHAQLATVVSSSKSCRRYINLAGETL